jgi:PAS domain S-box-containing protein
MTSSREVSDRIENEETLRESERLMRAMLDGIQAAIVVIDPDSTRILEINPVAERILGVTAEAVIGRRCDELTGRDLAEDQRCFLCHPGTGTKTREERIVRTDGRTVPVMVTTLGTHRAGREQLIHVFFDLTERKNLERQLAVAQKLDSIGQLASGIAHEINTPISTWATTCAS